MAMTTVVRCVQQGWMHWHFWPSVGMNDFFPPVIYYTTNHLDAGRQHTIYHELELHTGCMGAVDLGHPFHHLRLDDGQQLINPRIMTDPATHTTDGWDVTDLYQQIESIEQASACDFYRQPLDIPLAWRANNRLTRQRWNHIVVQYRTHPANLQVIQSFFNDDAICIQHYDDFLHSRWPCRWHQDERDEL
jgi:hypothetical protein